MKRLPVMMNRIKWLHYTNKSKTKNLKKLSSLLAKHSYTEKNSYGFLIDEVRKNHMISRYIIKRIIKREYDTPFGDIIEQEFLSYETTKFRLDDNGPGLELINPPRSITGFINKFSMITEFKITIKEPEIDLEKWLLNISNSCEIKINSMEYKDIQLTKNLLGKLHVSGKGDIEVFVNNFLKNKNRVLKKATLTINGNNAIISNNGSAHITNDDEDIIKILRETIPNEVNDID